MSEFSVSEREKLLKMTKQVEIMLTDVIYLPYTKAGSTFLLDVHMELPEASYGIPWSVQV